MSAVPRLAPAEPPTSDRDAASALFRPEALAARQNQWLGTVLLQSGPIYGVFAWLALATVGALIALLTFGSFARKTPATGWLAPPYGLSRVVAPQPGVVSAITVREGAFVKKGAPLLTISAELQSEALVATRQEVVERLTSRRDSLADSKTVQDALFAQQQRDATRRVQALTNELRFSDKELALQRARLDLSRQMLARETEMRARGLIPLPRLQRTKQDELDQAGRLQAMERARSSLERELAAAKGQTTELPLRRDATIGEINRNVSGLEQELAEAEARRKIVLIAPQDGVVSSVQAELGGAVGTAVPLLTIVPANAILQAHLYVPSRGIGFLKPGQKVQLRFQAFPYQKFGFQEGTVVAVSRSATSPSDLPPHLSAAAVTATAVNGAAEPVYRVTVDLPRQSVQAYGNATPLQAGMRVDADIFIESRRLIEWVFDPLFTITGKWGS